MCCKSSFLRLLAHLSSVCSVLSLATTLVGSFLHAYALVTFTCIYSCWTHYYHARQTSLSHAKLSKVSKTSLRQILYTCQPHRVISLVIPIRIRMAKWNVLLLLTPSTKQVTERWWGEKIKKVMMKNLIMKSM